MNDSAPYPDELHETDADLLAAWMADCTDLEKVGAWDPERKARAIALKRDSAPWVDQSIERIARGQERLDAEAAKHSWPAPLDLAALSGHEPRQPQFIVPDFIPAGYATLLAGHGGVGKSAIALYLAVCIALGLLWAGVACAARCVLYLSCEDREGVLHWRLDRICRHLGISLAELAGRLFILDLVGHDSILWDRDPKTGYTVTPGYGQLCEHMQRSGAEVLFVDGITDTYAGSNATASEVKRYVNALVGLVPPDTGAAVLLGHVSRPTAANSVTTEGYGGTTGWHNAVRSRMYLYPETEQADDAGRPERTGRLLLELQKSNLGRIDRAISWRWDDDAHLFLPEAAPTEFDRQHQSREERRGILLALKACMAASIIVPAAMSGPRTSYIALRDRPEFPQSMRSGKPAVRRFWREIEALRQLKQVDEESYERSNRHKALKLVLTQEGLRQCA